MIGAQQFAYCGVAGGSRSITPSPTPNWNDISFTNPPSTSAVNANVSIVGITEAVTFLINFTSGFADTTLKYRINSGSYTSIINGGTFSVSPNDTVNFQALNSTAPETSTFTVKNQTDSNALLDTITVTVT